MNGVNCRFYSNIPPPVMWVNAPPTDYERENEGQSGVLGKRSRVECDSATAPEKRVDLDPSTADLKTISGNDFQLLLQKVQSLPDPFEALKSHFTRKLNDPDDSIEENNEYWSCLIRLKDDSLVECQLAVDAWSSTSFGKFKEGSFRFIEIFENDPVTGKSEKKSLIAIRMSESHHKGEWLWINRGRHITGKEAKAMAEQISRAMKIKKCYLSDSAMVPSSDGINNIAIRIPLQVIFGKGFYANPFALAQTKKPKLAGLLVNDDSTNELEEMDQSGKENEAAIKIMYDQDVKEHQKELKWLQELKVKTIYHKIFKKGSEDQAKFAALLKRYVHLENDTKDITPTFINKCTWSFQKLMATLYEAKKENQQALADYEWVYFNLLDYTRLNDESSIQERYAWIVEKLFFNMLMVANF